MVDGEAVQGVSTEAGMPGCRIGCRIGPNPKISCNLEVWTRFKTKGCEMDS